MLTLDDALTALAKVTPDDVQSLAQQLFRDEALCLSVISTPGSTAGLENGRSTTSPKEIQTWPNEPSS